MENTCIAKSVLVAVVTQSLPSQEFEHYTAAKWGAMSKI